MPADYRRCDAELSRRNFSEVTLGQSSCLPPRSITWRCHGNDRTGSWLGSQGVVACHSTPHIVFNLADDLGYADVACYGRPDIRTPAIDRLATQGVRFLQAYANSAVCSATRVALITGRLPISIALGPGGAAGRQSRGRTGPDAPHAFVAAEKSRLRYNLGRASGIWGRHPNSGLCKDAMIISTDFVAALWTIIPIEMIAGGRAFRMMSCPSTKRVI